MKWIVVEFVYNIGSMGSVDWWNLALLSCDNNSRSFVSKFELNCFGFHLVQREWRRECYLSKVMPILRPMEVVGSSRCCVIVCPLTIVGNIPRYNMKYNKCKKINSYQKVSKYWFNSGLFRLFWINFFLFFLLAWPSQDVFLLPHIPWIGQGGNILLVLCAKIIRLAHHFLVLFSILCYSPNDNYLVAVAIKYPNQFFTETVFCSG